MRYGSVVRARAAQALRPRPALFRLQASFSGRGGRLGRHPPALDPERPPELLHQALHGQLPVTASAPLVLGDRAQDGPGPRDDSLFLPLAERRGRPDVEDGLHARLRLLGVLAARSARAGITELDLPERKNDRTSDVNRLAVHGSDSA